MEFVPQNDETEHGPLPQNHEPEGEFFNGNDEPETEEPPSDLLVPKSGMVFKSQEEIYQFYVEYARSVGFGVKKTSKKQNPKTGKVRYFCMECDRGGKHISTAKQDYNPRASKKLTCKAKVNSVINDEGEFTITTIHLEHNHALSPAKTRFFKCNKKMDEAVKRRLEVNDEAGIRLSKNFYSLAVEAGGYENLSFTDRDCRNHIQKVRQIRLGDGDAASLNNYFGRMQKRNSNFFYMVDINNEGRLRNVFWADARSIAAYESFGDVVSFDTTYLTNKYDMPFAPFVGVNHHRQTILFGCGLLSNEEADSYIWLFGAWLKCMSQAPNAIITDQCRSIQKGIREVFPNTHHRLCLWHIMRKLPEKLNTRGDYKQVKKVLKMAVYESISVEEFEEIWARMIDDFDLSENTWLSDLYEDRHRWVPVFVKGIFWAGMSTTQRSESINAFFDGYVGSKTSLKQFVEQYDNALKTKIEKENKADFASFSTCIPVITDLLLEKQLQEVYTNEVFKLFQDELRGLLYCNLSFVNSYESTSTFQVTDTLRKKEGASGKEVTYDVCYDEVKSEIQCSCRLFEFKGIICRHVVKVFVLKKVQNVPSQYILHRWRKDVKYRHTYVKNYYGDDMDKECRLRYNSLSLQCSKAVEIAFDTEEKFQYLMRIVDEATTELIEMSSNGNKQPTEATSTLMTGNDYEVSQKFTSPLKRKTKGRPQTKRKVSTLEKIINKKKRSQGSKNKKDQFGTQESQFGTQESQQAERGLEEEKDDHEDTSCGVCGEKEGANEEFWIGCDNCEKWFHGKCVDMTPARAEHIKRYKCFICSNRRARSNSSNISI